MAESARSDAILALIERWLDRGYLVETLSRLATISTHVEPGFNTLMEPDDAKLVAYVQGALRPELVRLGAYDLIDAPRNNLVLRLGRGETPRSLLLQNYTVTQHQQETDPGLAGRAALAAARPSAPRATSAPTRTAIFPGRASERRCARQSFILEGGCHTALPASKTPCWETSPAEG